MESCTGEVARGICAARRAVVDCVPRKFQAVNPRGENEEAPTERHPMSGYIVTLGSVLTGRSVGRPSDRQG